MRTLARVTPLGLVRYPWLARLKSLWLSGGLTQVLQLKHAAVPASCATFAKGGRKLRAFVRWVGILRLFIDRDDSLSFPPSLRSLHRLRRLGHGQCFRYREGVEKPEACIDRRDTVGGP